MWTASARHADIVLPATITLEREDIGGAAGDPLLAAIQDPAADKPICMHGNPNVLTRDAGASKLAQGCTGQLTRVEIDRFDGPLPPVKAYDPP